MRITISGKPGSGKSTVAKILASRLGLKHYSNGDFMRDIAKRRGLTFIELTKIAETDRSIDDELDYRQILLAKEDNFVIDSRLGFHFIPDSIKIFIDVDLDKAAERIFKEKRQGQPAESIEEVKAQLGRIMKSERMRYKQYYNLDIDDMKNYDLVIDSSKISAEKVADKIINFIKHR